MVVVQREDILFYELNRQRDTLLDDADGSADRGAARRGYTTHGLAMRQASERDFAFALACLEHDKGRAKTENFGQVYASCQYCTRQTSG